MWLYQRKRLIYSEIFPDALCLSFWFSHTHFPSFFNDTGILSKAMRFYLVIYMISSDIDAIVSLKKMVKSTRNISLPPKGTEVKYFPKSNKKMNLEVIGLNLCIYVVMVPVSSFCQPPGRWLFYFLKFLLCTLWGLGVFTVYVTTKLTTKIGKFISCLE